MFIIRWDVTGSNEVRLPDRDADIVALADAFIAYEASLPPEQQLCITWLGPLRENTEICRSALSASSSGEVQRASASEQLKQELERALELLDQGIFSLKLRCSPEVIPPLLTRSNPPGA